MKKIFTLFFAVGMITMVQAQPGTRDIRQTDQRNIQQNDQRNNQQYDQRNNQQYDQRDFDDGYGKVIANNHNSYDNDSRNGNKFANERRMKIEIAQINHEYDHKIEHVRDNFFMFRYEKQRQIRMLEHQRQFEINRVYAQFNNYYGKNGHHDKDNRKDRRY